MSAVFGRVFLFASVFVLLASPATGQASSSSSRKAQNPFSRPMQDLDEIEGEVVWVQATLLRGDPTPYRSDVGPLATPEQGLLDNDGKLWTFLDNPRGRELRYDHELRGQTVIVKGWIYEQSSILEVLSWSDRSRHPVRIKDDIPEVVRIPFDPEQVETIDSIPPVAPSIIDPEILDLDLWKIQEGTDLEIGSQAPISSATTIGGVDRLNQLLKNVPLGQGESPPSESESSQEKDAPAQDSVSPESEEAPGSSSKAPSATEPIKPVKAPEPRDADTRFLNQRGQALTQPEEFDEALEKALLE